jgi:hypothetical protein
VNYHLFVVGKDRLAKLDDADVVTLCDVVGGPHIALRVTFAVKGATDTLQRQQTIALTRSAVGDQSTASTSVKPVEVSAAKPAEVSAAAATTASTSIKEAATSDEKLSDMLVCAICAEIYHNVTCTTPCNHWFCGSCISQWLEKHDDCPTCRARVRYVGRNAPAAAIVESYLETHKERRRTPEDLALLDKHDRVHKTNGLNVKRKRGYDDDDDDGDDDDGRYDDDDGSFHSDEEDSFETRLRASLRARVFGTVVGIGARACVECSPAGKHTHHTCGIDSLLELGVTCLHSRSLSSTVPRACWSATSVRAVRQEVLQCVFPRASRHLSRMHSGASRSAPFRTQLCE